MIEAIQYGLLYLCIGSLVGAVIATAMPKDVSVKEIAVGNVLWTFLWLPMIFAALSLAMSLAFRKARHG